MLRLHGSSTLSPHDWVSWFIQRLRLMAVRDENRVILKEEEGREWTSRVPISWSDGFQTLEKVQIEAGQGQRQLVRES